MIDGLVVVPVRASSYCAGATWNSRSCSSCARVLVTWMAAELPKIDVADLRVDFVPRHTPHLEVANPPNGFERSTQ